MEPLKSLVPLPRKIIHIDMVAFYASVEQRESPDSRGEEVLLSSVFPTNNPIRLLGVTLSEFNARQ
jgi:nucleotidyltransferase/DNA polymerase involved in DNA repair